MLWMSLSQNVGFLTTRRCCLLLLAILFLLIHFRVIPFCATKVAIDCKPKGLGTKVPEIIHQNAEVSLSQETADLYRRSWKSCYPKWKHLLWTDAMNRHLVIEHFPWFLETYDSLRHRACRADAARYMYLYLYGGVSADLDTECIRPFTSLLRYSVVLGRMKNDARVSDSPLQNSLMVSIPRHPFWLEMLRYIAVTRPCRNAVPDRITDSGALMAISEEHGAVCPQDLLVYPSHFFNPISMNTTVTACKLLGAKTNAEREECRRMHSYAYVIKYHEVS